MKVNIKEKNAVQFNPVTISITIETREELLEFFKGMGDSTGKHAYELYTELEKLVDSHTCER